jgi:HK97 gp10 family phage protein
VEETVQIQGLPEIKATWDDLRGWPDWIRREFTVAAFDIQARAQRAAPVRTGRLRASIAVINNPPQGGVVGVGVNVNYAGFVEYGTRYMRARPYFWPAVDLAMQNFYARVATLIGTRAA